MNKQVNFTGLDPLKITEVMNLIGMETHYLAIPRYYNQLKDIVNYFAESPNLRYDILKVISNKQGNKFDVLWTYVELQKEKAAKVQVLDPEDFESNIAEEIVAGHVTKSNRSQLSEVIRKKKEELERKKEEAKFQTSKDKAVEKIFDETKLDLYANTLRELEAIEQELSAY